MELKPCPFCGSSNTRVFDLIDVKVSCNDCFASGPSISLTPEDATTTINLNEERYKQEAIEAWNKRAQDDE